MRDERPLSGVSGRGIAGVYRGYCRMKPEAFGGAWEVAAEGISAAKDDECLSADLVELGWRLVAHDIKGSCVAGNRGITVCFG